MKEIPLRTLSSSVALLSFVACAQAQTTLAPPPDAGRILQELATPPALPRRESSPLRIEPPEALTTLPGGTTAELQAVEFSGNTVFDAATLAAVLGDVAGQRHDLAGLRALAERVAAFYRENGYPFVRAYLPAQQLLSGVLRIAVLEGRYGRVEPRAEVPWLSEGARPFLAPLRTGEIIDGRTLERVVLLLEDQPGIRVAPLVRPGQAPGEGDLSVAIERDSRVSGQVGLDNAGNRYSGEWRALATVAFDSPFAFGDRLVMRSLVTNERLWLGGVDYERPLGGSGLRGQAGLARTSYTLGGPYRAVGANGIADVATLRAAYPVVRTQLANLSVSVAYLRKALEDRADVVGDVRTRTSSTWPVTLQFDQRDGFGSGGVSWGALVWTTGHLQLDGTQRHVDAASSRTSGGFNKLNLDVARIQRLGQSLALYGRYSAQWADKNLDSSEAFALGGIYGVRAYPPGEGLGARGWLAQTELRYLAGPWTPYVLLDAGGSQANVHAWDAASGVKRQLSGTGLGARFGTLRWTLDATLAWRMRGGVPASDSRDRNPRLWVSAAYRF